MNFIDKTISYLSPGWGFERAKVREKIRSYEAAQHSRRTKSFDRARSSGPNYEITNALVTLRNRARYFARNNGWAKRAVEAITNNTVGEGIRPAPMGSRNQIKKVKQLWKNWAESTACDWYGRNTFYGLQSLIMKEIAEGGEVLVIRRRVKSNDGSIPIKLQVVESDQLDHQKDFLVESDGSYSRLGVKFNRDGQLLGYWVFDYHPSDGLSFFEKNTLTSTFISKDDCLQVFEILRVGQIRGIPMGVTSFIKTSDFSDYEDAQLMKQKVACAFAGIIQGDELKDNDTLEHIEPGTFQYLNSGETITFPNTPTSSDYDPYTTKILQGIAASWGITYEMLTMDYSKVNFSSGKMAQINVIANFKKWQYNMLVPQLCVPVWNWFMDAAIMAGQTATKIVCSATDWTAPRIPQLDPNKETSARILAIQGGLTTVSECLREDGRDPEEFFEEYKADMERLKELGITISSIILPQIVEPSNNNNNANN